MPWSSNKTWVAATVLTAADLNTYLRDQLNAILAGIVKVLQWMFDGVSSDPGVAPATDMVLYYNSTKNDIRFSRSAGAYRSLLALRVQTLAISSNVLTVDLAESQFFQFTMNANITTMTINGVVFDEVASFVVKVTGNGTPYTWAWFTSTVKWPSAYVPERVSTSGKVDVFSFITYDGGTTWLGSPVGQVYTP
jgi:hypothetical protein